MGIKKALGGERLGSGNKMNVTLHGFNRSSHNIGQLFKTDQAIGTLVPYFCDIGLNGTTYDIDLTTKIRTLPTNGPIFGRLKHQIDVFHAPIRLYIRVLHNNALGIGMKMQNVKLPVMTLRANQPDMTKDDLNSQQISQDSLMAYLGVRGLGRSKNGGTIVYKNVSSNVPAHVLGHLQKLLRKQARRNRIRDRGKFTKLGRNNLVRRNGNRGGNCNKKHKQKYKSMENQSRLQINDSWRR